MIDTSHLIWTSPKVPLQRNVKMNVCGFETAPSTQSPPTCNIDWIQHHFDVASACPLLAAGTSHVQFDAQVHIFPTGSRPLVNPGCLVSKSTEEK